MAIDKALPNTTSEEIEVDKMAGILPVNEEGSPDIEIQSRTCNQVSKNGN